MTPKTDNEKIKYFEETVLKGTCFRSLKELKADVTLVQVNAPRALIACELIGCWRGFNIGLQLKEMIKVEIDTKTGKMKFKTPKPSFPAKNDKCEPRGKGNRCVK